VTDDEQRIHSQDAVVSGRGVEERTGRRRFSDAYRVRIVKEANRCQRPGEAVALLRREGLLSLVPLPLSKQYAAGALSGGHATFSKAIECLPAGRRKQRVIASSHARPE